MTLSLRNRIFLIFTFLLTIPIIVLSIIIPNQLSIIFEEQTKSSTLDMMEQYAYHIDGIATQAEELGKQALLAPSTQRWLESETNPTELEISEQWIMTNDLRNEYSAMVLNNSYDMSIFAFLDSGQGVWSRYPSMEEADWYESFIGDDQRWVKAHVDPTFSQVEYTNSFLLPLVDIDTLESSGVIKINLPSSIFTDALENITLGEEGRISLLNNLGENVLAEEAQISEEILNYGMNSISNNNTENGLLETTYDGNDYLIFYQKLAVGDWILFSEITKDELFHRINELKSLLLLISGLIFILTVFASYILSTNIVRPLGKLVKTMGFIETGDFDGAKRMMPAINSDTNEVDYLIKSVDHTIDKLNQLIKFEYKANLRRKDAEYKALLLQINPHFMNNTLEIIGGLAAQGKNKEVVDVSVYLGRMMRYSLNTQSDSVPLKEEISYIRSFTEILKLRYEDSLSVEIDEDPDTKNLSIIKFIIQPLVENAVKYSFIQKSFVKIKIKTEMDNDDLIITVQDNGVGMSEKIISDLNNYDIGNEASNVLDSKGTSIGLKNVISRLRLYYNSAFSFQIFSEKDIGTRIVLRINIEGDIHVTGSNYR